MEGKETEGSLMMEMKGQETSGSDREDDRDMLSELPDCVLLHILNLKDTKFAVQTCVLCKRWKDLWKRRTNLALDSVYFSRAANFDKFVSWVLSNLDDSISLRTLDLRRRSFIEPTLLNRVMKYGVPHNVQQLTIDISLKFKPGFEFVPFIFSCPSLTSLTIFRTHFGPSMRKLPKSLQLPALKSLRLENVTFTASDNDYAEPFSTCKMLNTLVFVDCCLDNYAKVLCISNSNLSSLAIYTNYRRGYKIDLSTPNLSSLGILGCSINQLSSICDLSALEKVNIDSKYSACSWNTNLLNLSWLQEFSNVKIMTLSSDFLNIILNDLSNPGSMRTQPPCFVRLETLKVKMKSFARISKEELNRVVEYLLQNSSLASVDVIKCWKSYGF